MSAVEKDWVLRTLAGGVGSLCLSRGRGLDPAHSAELAGCGWEYEMGVGWGGVGQEMPWQGWEHMEVLF